MALNPGAGAEGLSRARASVTSETELWRSGAPYMALVTVKPHLFLWTVQGSPGYHWLLDH